MYKYYSLPYLMTTVHVKQNRFIIIPSKMATLYFMQNGIINYWCNLYFMLKMITCTKRIIQNMNSHCHLLKYKYIQQFYLNIFTECSTFSFYFFKQQLLFITIYCFYYFLIFYNDHNEEWNDETFSFVHY